MFFDILAVLIITFFAALGMVEVSDYFFKRGFHKDIRRKTYIIADFDSIAENDIEDSVRYLLTDCIGNHNELIIDCRNISDEAYMICKNLEIRFNCKTVTSEKELSDIVISGLHE